MKCLNCARATLSGSPTPARGCKCTSDPAPLWLRAGQSAKILVAKDDAERPGYDGPIKDERSIAKSMSKLGMSFNQMPRDKKGLTSELT